MSKWCNLKLSLLALLLTGSIRLSAQLYGEAGVSVPDSKLKNLAGTGIAIGPNYEYRLTSRFKARLSASFVYFAGKHYPRHGVPVGQPVSSDYKISMLPIQAGVKFFPFSKFLSGKFFVGGRLGVQSIFYESHFIGYQESVLYRSCELNFSYVPSAGFDLKIVCFEYEWQFITSQGNQTVNSASYSTIKMSIRIFPKGG